MSAPNNSKQVSMYSAFVMIIADNELSERLSKICSSLCSETNMDDSVHPEMQEIAEIVSVPLSTSYKDICPDIIKVLAARVSSKLDDDGWTTVEQKTAPKIRGLGRLIPGYNLVRYSRVVSHQAKNIERTHSSIVGVESKKWYSKKNHAPNLTIFGGSNKGRESMNLIENPEVCARRECWEETKIVFSDVLFSEQTQMAIRVKLGVNELPYNFTLPPNADSCVGSSFFTIILPSNVTIRITDGGVCGKCIILSMSGEVDDPKLPDRDIRANVRQVRKPPVAPIVSVEIDDELTLFSKNTCGICKNPVTDDEIYCEECTDLM